MNTEQMLNRIVRMFTRRAVNKGIRKGIDHMAGQGKPPAEMSPEERKRARAMKKQSQQAKRAARMARKIGRL